MFLPLPCHLPTESIQNPYWALSLYIFRLQAVIFSCFFTHLFIFISLFFILTSRIGDEKKKHKRMLPKNPSKPKSIGALHRDKDVNQWKEHMMEDCIDEYYRELAANNNIPEVVNRAAITKKYEISPSTLHHCVLKSKSSRQVLGHRHTSGGKRHPVYSR